MRNILLFLLLVFHFTAGQAQSVGSLNLNYLYNPLNEIDFTLKPVIRKDHILVYYTFMSRTAESKIEDYAVTWERRESFNQREGTPLTVEETDVKTAPQKKSGWLSFALPDKPWLLVARVKNVTSNAAWTYVKVLEAKYPVNGYLSGTDEVLDHPYVAGGGAYTVHGSEKGKNIFGFYYRENFLPASPPFVESESHVDRFLFQDSTFRISSEDTISLKSGGLYLLQEDTASEAGFAFLSVRASYPKFTHVEDLLKPMVYICTQPEYDQLKSAGSDKVKFDKVILGITGDKDRAKNFIRSYFRRVELANFYFTSYKEGWKTDRGMIYLIFGNPSEITFNGESEVWRYKNLDQSFTFVKTGSVYGPEYFVLVRDKRYAETWYATIDLWRKSRF